MLHTISAVQRFYFSIYYIQCFFKGVFYLKLRNPARSAEIFKELFKEKRREAAENQHLRCVFKEKRREAAKNQKLRIFLRKNSPRADFLRNLLKP